MDAIKVLTVKAAADRLGTYRANVHRLLAARHLTLATINGKPAVLDDDRLLALVPQEREA